VTISSGNVTGVSTLTVTNGVQCDNVVASGTVSASTLSGNMDASYITSGTLESARIADGTDMNPANLTVSGALTVAGSTTLYPSGHVIPQSNLLYDLGSPTSVWRDVYLSGSTIYLGNATISETGGNVVMNRLVVDGTVTADGLTPPLSITSVEITDNAWTVLDDTAVGLDGGYVQLHGVGFAPACLVQVGTVNASSTTYVSSTVLRCLVPARPSGTYSVTVIRGDSVTATLPSSLTYSDVVSWITPENLGNIFFADPFVKSIVATSDSTVTYGNLTAIPSGTTLDAATGNLTGNILLENDSIFSIDVVSEDLENQTSEKTFLLDYKALNVSNVQVTDMSWSVLQQTALDSDSTGYILVNGSYFLSTDTVQIGGTPAATTYVSSSSLGALAPAKSSGLYDATVLRNGTPRGLIDGVKYSIPPSWSTASNLGEVDENTDFSYTFVATSDSSVSYTNTTALPPGSTLNTSSGVFTGNVTSLSDDQTFSFEVVATDQDFQTNVRTFLLTVLSEVFGSFVVASDSIWIIVTDKNTIISLGSNQYGANGNGDGTNGVFITDSGSLSGKTVSYVSSCGKGSLIVTHFVCTDGTLHATGYGANYQFGDGTIANVSIPKQISIGKTVVSVSSGYEHSCLVTSDGMLYGTGKNTYYQLGQNTTATYGSWTRINTGTLANRGIKSVACGGWSTMVIDQYDFVHVMGYGDYGNLGNYQSFPSGYWGIETVRTPYIIPKYTAGSFKVNDTARSVACGEQFSVVVRTDGTVHSTGRNTHGQLGDGTYNNSNGIFVQVGGALAGKNVTEVSINNSLGTMDHAHVLTADGKVYGWGKNYYACLGIGSTGGNSPGTNYTSPVLLGGSLTGKQVVSLSSGTYGGLAITSDGLVHGWGVTSYTGEIVELLVPTVIGLKPGEPPGFVPN
jgi:alpha-tubulin suppressor-like RCC1 family protein